MGHGVATVGAAGSIPAIQLHIGRLGVVGLEHRADQQEEVADQSAFQGGADGDGRIPRTKPLIADMGMNDAIPAGGGVAIQGDDGIGIHGIGPDEGFQLQVDLKFPQLDAFEFDGLGLDA